MTKTYYGIYYNRNNFLHRNVTKIRHNHNGLLLDRHVPMIGTYSSGDRLIFCQNSQINSDKYLSHSVFSGIKSSTAWNVKAIAQTPRQT